jgi:hypothetical protein
VKTGSTCASRSRRALGRRRSGPSWSTTDSHGASGSSRRSTTTESEHHISTRCAPSSPMCSPGITRRSPTSTAWRCAACARTCASERRFSTSRRCRFRFPTTRTWASGPLRPAGRCRGWTAIAIRRGVALFDPSRYADHGAQLEFLEQELRPYPQLASPFQPALSIIDVMMFNSVDEWPLYVAAERVGDA